VKQKEGSPSPQRAQNKKQGAALKMAWQQPFLSALVEILYFFVLFRVFEMRFIHRVTHHPGCFSKYVRREVTREEERAGEKESGRAREQGGEEVRGRQSKGARARESEGTREQRRESGREREGKRTRARKSGRAKAHGSGRTRERESQ